MDTHAQKETNWWYFIRSAGLDFSNISPIADTNLNDSASAVFSAATGDICSISDEYGVLQFYGSYASVINRNHRVMPNGIIGLPQSTGAEQGCIIVPRPNRPGEYYLFYARSALVAYTDGIRSGVFYSLIDMELDDGFGDVVDSAKNLLMADSTEEKITSTPHANGIDYWVMVRQTDSNFYHAYLVTEHGVSTNPVTTSIGASYSNYGNQNGNLRFNHSGDMFAHLNASGLEIFDFDNNTGVISNLRVITPFYVALGLEFSPDDSKLYSGGPTQFDVSIPTQSAIQASELYMGGAFPIMAGLQLGLDGKIYGNTWTGTSVTTFYMDVIHDPNALGSLCGYEDSALYLDGRLGGPNVPQFLSSYYNTNFYADTICIGEAASFYMNFTFIDSVFWNFGDPGSGSLNTDTALAPKHLYSDTGSYTVTLIAQNGIKTDTVIKTIYVKGVPTIDLGPDQELCSVDQDSITLGNYGLSGVYEWSDGSDDSTLLVVAENIPGSASFWLQYTNECGSDRDTIELIVN